MQQKKQILLLIAAMLLAIQLVEATLNIQENQIKGGSSDTQRNTELTDIGFTVKNTGSFPISNFSFTFDTNSKFSGRDFKINVEFPQTTLSPSSSMTPKIKVTVPEEFDAVNEDLQEADFEIGKLKISGKENQNGTESNTESNLLPIKMQAENNLKITKVEMKQGDTQKTFSQNTTYDIIADDQVEFKFSIENLFDDSSLNNVKIQLIVDDLSIDEDTTIDQIDSSDTQSETIDVTFDAGDAGSTYNAKVLVSGKDENDGLHGKIFLFKINLKEPDTASDTSSANTDTSSTDSDGDGVADVNDNCPNTVTVCQVDTNGCPLDDDHDGICNNLDPTPSPQQKQETKTAEEISHPENNIKDNQEQNKPVKILKEDNPQTDDTSFGPFLIGLMIGIIITSVFFFIIRS